MSPGGQTGEHPFRDAPRFGGSVARDDVEPDAEVDGTPCGCCLFADALDAGGNVRRRFTPRQGDVNVPGGDVLGGWARTTEEQWRQAPLRAQRGRPCHVIERPAVVKRPALGDAT